MARSTGWCQLGAAAVENSASCCTVDHSPHMATDGGGSPDSSLAIHSSTFARSSQKGVLSVAHALGHVAKYAFVGWLELYGGQPKAKPASPLFLGLLSRNACARMQLGFVLDSRG
jgi:hypothetical protein